MSRKYDARDRDRTRAKTKTTTKGIQRKIVRSGETVELDLADTGGMAGYGISVSGEWTGLLRFEVRIGREWRAVDMTFGMAVESATRTNGTWKGSFLPGASAIRVRAETMERGWAWVRLWTKSERES